MLLKNKKTVHKCCKPAKCTCSCRILKNSKSSSFANSEDCFALRRVYICEGQVYVPQRQSAKRPDFDHPELYLRFFSQIIVSIATARLRHEKSCAFANDINVTMLKRNVFISFSNKGPSSVCSRSLSAGERKPTSDSLERSQVQLEHNFRLLFFKFADS